MRLTLSFVAALMTNLLLSASMPFGAVTAQAAPSCDESGWIPTFGGHLDLNGAARAMTVFDDGSGGGPALYVGGDFTSAGGVTVNGVARWDGQTWSALGAGIDGEVHTLAVFDDGLGGGPALYAGGQFFNADGVPASRIAKWDGLSWSPLGSGVSGIVRATAVFDDGSGGGPALYVGGTFNLAGGQSVGRIAKWDGRTWSPLGTGVTSSVEALTVFDDGSGGGAALYAGGWFSSAGDVPASRIAKWDGTSWSALDTGVSSTQVSAHVQALTVFDDGSGNGPALYVGGRFTSAGDVTANHIAKWDGRSWSALDMGVSGASNPSVQALTVFDDGSGGGPALYAGGNFTAAGDVAANRIARWDGQSWSALGAGVNGAVQALAVFDDGAGGGPALYAGGGFTTVDEIPAGRIGKWESRAWSVLAPGTNGIVLALTFFDDGSESGPALYAGGGFTSIGGVPANCIARWDGQAWLPLGTGMNGSVQALAVFDDGSGSGPALYAGGWFSIAGGVIVNGIAKWDGRTWSALGTGVEGANALVRALAVFDDGSGGGPALYAGGNFITAGGVTVNHIAKWDGRTWSALGTGIGTGTSSSAVHALAVFDDGSGSGPALYTGGQFSFIGGLHMPCIAKWDGEAWSALGAGMNGSVHALTVFDDGSGGGPALYAGGAFSMPGILTLNPVAKWDGRTWAPLGASMYGVVYALTVFDDGLGDGPALYAGGHFATNWFPMDNIARWKGGMWEALGSGVNAQGVRALAVFDDGSDDGPALYVGGWFFSSPGGDSYLARWRGCAVIGELADLNGDGVVDGADLGILLASWGPCASCAADFNGDGLVDGADLGKLLAAWGGGA